jgi:hypothetical protein
METEEKIEKELKERLSSIKPSRILFDRMMESVTKNESNRYIEEKADVLSFYQLINKYINMKKNLLIGVPIAIVLVIAVLLVAKPANKNEPIAQNGVINPQMEDITSQDKIVKEDNSSIDNILVNFEKDAEIDLVLSQNESEDASMLRVELENYSNIKTYSYDQTL